MKFSLEFKAHCRWYNVKFNDYIQIHLKFIRYFVNISEKFLIFFSVVRFVFNWKVYSVTQVLYDFTELIDEINHWPIVYFNANIFFMQLFQTEKDKKKLFQIIIHFHFIWTWFKEIYFIFSSFFFVLSSGNFFFVSVSTFVTQTLSF